MPEMTSHKKFWCYKNVSSEAQARKTHGPCKAAEDASKFWWNAIARFWRLRNEASEARSSEERLQNIKYQNQNIKGKMDVVIPLSFNNLYNWVESLKIAHVASND